MTKKQELIGMLKKPFGAKRETIMAKLCWQEHSVRGQISLLKKEGYAIVGSKGVNGFVYKIVASEVDKDDNTIDEQSISEITTTDQAIDNTIEEQTTSNNRRGTSSMKKSSLIAKLKKHFDSSDIIKYYSGRFMYGKTCVGVVVDDITTLIDILPKDVLQQSRGDHFGKRKIIYFPEVRA